MPQKSEVHFIAGPQTDANEERFLFHPFSLEQNPPINIAIREEKTGDDFNALKAEFNYKNKTRKFLSKSEENSTQLEDYSSLFKKAISAIEEHALTKVILSQKTCLNFDSKNTFELYESLLNHNLNAFVFLFFHPLSGAWIGASPELILTQQNENFSTTALAGTKTDYDSKWGTKETEEHRLVSDFISNTLEPISNNITLSDVYTAKAGKIYHLKQDISFKSSNNSVVDFLKKLHPTPAIGGLPQQAAKDFILSNESHSRNYYCGYLGRVKKDESHIFVNLRSAQIFSNQIHIYSGGGITKDSVLEKEWEECQKKAENISQFI